MPELSQVNAGNMAASPPFSALRRVEMSTTSTIDNVQVLAVPSPRQNEGDWLDRSGPSLSVTALAGRLRMKPAWSSSSIVTGDEAWLDHAAWQHRQIERCSKPATKSQLLFGEGLGFQTSTTVIPEAIALNWQGLAQSAISEQTYRVLLTLAQMEDGWNGSGSRRLSAASLSYYLEFWQEVRHFAVQPELVLTPGGTLQAEWTKGRKRHLEIDFNGENGKHYFGLFDGQTAVIEGAAPLKEVVQIILSHRRGAALRWRFDAS